MLYEVITYWICFTETLCINSISNNTISNQIFFNYFCTPFRQNEIIRIASSIISMASNFNAHFRMLCQNLYSIQQDWKGFFINICAVYFKIDPN